MGFLPRLTRLHQVRGPLRGTESDGQKARNDRLAGKRPVALFWEQEAGGSSPPAPDRGHPLTLGSSSGAALTVKVNDCLRGDPRGALRHDVGRRVDRLPGGGVGPTGHRLCQFLLHLERGTGLGVATRSIVPPRPGTARTVDPVRSEGGGSLRQGSRRPSPHVRGADGRDPRRHGHREGGAGDPRRVRGRRGPLLPLRGHVPRPCRGAARLPRRVQGVLGAGCQGSTRKPDEWFQHLERDWGTRSCLWPVQETYPSRLGDEGSPAATGGWFASRSFSSTIAVDRMRKDTDA